LEPGKEKMFIKKLLDHLVKPKPRRGPDPDNRPDPDP
jgi:hypothetical protein